MEVVGDDPMDGQYLGHGVRENFNGMGHMKSGDISWNLAII